MGERADNAAQWLAAARAGSPEALGRALEACRGYLLLIAQQELQPELRAKGGASDLVQETFIKAHRHFDRFQGSTEAEWLAWLRRLLLNNLADFRRLYQEADKRRADREVPLGAGSSADRGPGLEDAAASPSGLAMGQEQAERVRQALDRLPEDYRQILLLRNQEDRPFEEIAGLMGRSANAVRKLWARAVERFQHEWEAFS
jgi:RNA polymerase sigma-70 factor (ECF subfamily)